MKDYYRVLEVHREASPEVIEKAYRILIQKYHPDHFHLSNKAYAEEKVKALNEAYTVLRDAKQRHDYDAQCAEISSSNSNKGLDRRFRYRHWLIMALGLIGLLIFSKNLPLPLLMSFAGKAILIISMTYVVFRLIKR